jgi:hypothetical protein
LSYIWGAYLVSFALLAAEIVLLVYRTKKSEAKA